MKSAFLSFVFALVLGSIPASKAQDNPCALLLKFGIFDESNNYSEESFSDAVIDFFARNKFESYESASSGSQSIGFSVPDYFAIDFAGSNSSSNSSSWGEQLKSLYSRDTQFRSQARNAMKSVNNNLVQTYLSCVREQYNRGGLFAKLEPAAAKNLYKLKLKVRRFDQNSAETLNLQKIDIYPKEAGSADFRPGDGFNGENETTVYIKKSPDFTGGFEVRVQLNSSSYQANAGTFGAPSEVDMLAARVRSEVKGIKSSLAEGTAKLTSLTATVDQIPKVKVLTGVANGHTAVIPHGLNLSQIVSVNVMIKHNAHNRWYSSANYQARDFVVFADDSVVNIHHNDGPNFNNFPVRIVILYTP